MLMPYSKKVGGLYNVYNQFVVVINARLKENDLKQVLICFALIVLVFLSVNVFNKKYSKRYVLLLSGYLTFIISMTILGRENGQCVNSWSTIFLTYKLIFMEHMYNLLYDVILNIVLFIPLGFLIRMKSSTFQTLKIAFVVSLVIETVQLFQQSGIFEIADLTDNVLGAGIGNFIYCCTIRYRQP